MASKRRRRDLFLFVCFDSKIVLLFRPTKNFCQGCCRKSINQQVVTKIQHQRIWSVYAVWILPQNMWHAPIFSIWTPWLLFLGFGVTFCCDTKTGAWTVQDLLENFCSNQQTDESFELLPGDEVVQVTWHVQPHAAALLSSRGNRSMGTAPLDLMQRNLVGSFSDQRCSLDFSNCILATYIRALPVQG